MNILGAILAGGQSRRFGADKAEALFEGKPLLEHVADALAPQVGALVVVGREWTGFRSVPDYPSPALGPLGGLAGALICARDSGFDSVLSTGCDLIGIPRDLAQQLGHGPAIIDAQPLLGLWPIATASALTAWLADDRNRSVYSFAEHIGARRVQLFPPVRNVNRLQDLP